MRKKRILISGLLLISILTFSQVGINTTTPQRTLHVNGSLQLTKELNVGGNEITAGNPGEAGQVLKSNGPNQPPSWRDLLDVPNSEGTLIAVSGAFFVAQEIVVQMSGNFSVTGGSASILGNLDSEIVDNESKYSGNATTNSFQVSVDGTYQVIMNMQLSTTKGSNPVIGIWDNVSNKWIARVNDTYTAADGTRQTYSLITGIPMLAGRDYSFRASSNVNCVINKGGSGSVPMSYVSVKRMK
ncbi:Uncharacterised protein [Chryseobacterium nakagawai]|uniref:Uncharacterized protein n=1 Tax=Chryseobacterium nakagawai TaxID=1241982 RepID=A0AAD1DT50_CHRNA|nr:hypothetical protein [Chryseobacterium nakagawai]AZA93603.1 hypothetical protein EG343_24855 [Chryseobacterium nakagawai]VEH20303.1 Uncharacterised protein [Chryseobacterium nakagawai]